MHHFPPPITVYVKLSLLRHLRFHLRAAHGTVRAGKTAAAVGPSDPSRLTGGASVIMDYMLYYFNVVCVAWYMGYGFFL